MNCLRSLKRWNHGFESHSRHGCLCAFILCVGSGLPTGWSLSNDSYRLWLNYGTEKAAKAQKGCRAIEKRRQLDDLLMNERVFLRGGETESTCYVSHYLAYCTSPDDDECRAVGGMRIVRRNRSTRIKPAPMPLCPPHDLTWDWTRAAAVGSRRLTAWVIARPNEWSYVLWKYGLYPCLLLLCKYQEAKSITTSITSADLYSGPLKMVQYHQPI
jgi:hypothetical protein